MLSLLYMYQEQLFKNNIDAILIATVFKKCIDFDLKQIRLMNLMKITYGLSWFMIFFSISTFSFFGRVKKQNIKNKCQW